MNNDFHVPKKDMWRYHESEFKPAKKNKRKINEYNTYEANKWLLKRKNKDCLRTKKQETCLPANFDHEVVLYFSLVFENRFFYRRKLEAFIFTI